MTKTLITDDFDHGHPTAPLPGAPVHSIVYGRVGYTDSLDEDVLTTLLAAGVIRISDVKYHAAGKTVLYVSNEGVLDA